MLAIGNTHSNPSAKAFLAKFASIVKEVGHMVYFIAADSPPAFPNVRWIPRTAGQSTVVPTRLLRFARCQMGICLLIVRMRAKYDQAVVLPAAFSLPVLILRALGKRVLVYVDGKPTERLIRVSCKTSLAFAKVLLVETNSLLDVWGIRDRKRGRSCALYVDTARFVATTHLENRPSTVGFFGALNPSKGIREMLGAVRLLSEREKALKFIIGGSGNMEEEIKRFSSDYPIIDFRGQIASTSMPAALNECKLIVVPSYAEGLPNIVLEAMACGTPVLATRIGGIPDVIADEENGFLLPENTRECIADSVLRALHHPHLSRIAENASEKIESEFTLERAMNRYRRIFSLFGNEEHQV